MELVPLPGGGQEPLQFSQDDGKLKESTMLRALERAVAATVAMVEEAPDRPGMHPLVPYLAIVTCKKGGRPLRNTPASCWGQSQGKRHKCPL
mmetsp:Transcript_67999/g.134132  ORF Transcript_67999/g.134132 Transcript_67999/m.134132 type:complete len:92 (-) Transcript_67999:289-564(-)